MLKIEEFETTSVAGLYETSETTTMEFIKDIDKLAAQTLGDAIAMDGSSINKSQTREVRVFNDIMTAFKAVKRYSLLSAKISDANMRHIDDEFDRLNKKIDMLLNKIDSLKKESKKE